MGDLLLPGSSGSSQPSRGGLITTPGGSISGDMNTSAAKVSLQMSNLGGSAVSSAGNLGAGFIGVGKGLVSLAENLPIIGGIAKPLIRFTGGIMDATVGNVVRAAEGIRLPGNSNLAEAATGALEFIGTPLKWGMDALAAGSEFAQSEVAKARINSTMSGQQDIIRTVFGDAPASAVQAVRNGATIEEAAKQLADSNAGFSQDGAHNFLWSLIIDPINLIAPGVGKAVSIGARASEFARFVKVSDDAAILAAKAAGRLEEAEKLIEAQRFVEKWGWAGTVYDATIGKMKGAMGRLAPKYAKEITRVIWRVHKPKVVNDVIDTVVLFSGGGREVAERGLRNVAITAAGAVRSGVVRAVASIRRMSSDNLSKSIVGYVEREIRNGADLSTILSTKLEESTLSLGEILTNSGFKEAEQLDFLKIIEGQAKSGVRSDELLKTAEVQNIIKRVAKGHNDWYVRNRTDAMRATARWREHLDARIGSEQATKIFSETKQEQIAIARGIQERLARGVSVEESAAQLVDDLVGGFGMRQEDAVKAATTIVKKYANDIDGLADALSIAKASNYGRRVEGLALIRGKILARIKDAGDKIDEKFGRITLISGKTITEADVASIKSKVASLKEAERVAKEAGDEAGQKAARAKMAELADDVVYTFDDAAATFDPKFPIDASDIESAKLAGRHTYDDVFEWVNKVEGKAARSIGPDEIAEIRKLAKTESIFNDLLTHIEDLKRAGYRLGFAPEDGVSEANSLRHLEDGTEAWQDVALPFVDTLDAVDIAKIDKGLEGINLRPSRMEGILDRFTRRYGSETIRSNVTERFISSLVQKTGISVRKARTILSKVNSQAAELNLRPQSMFLERGLIEKIFVEEMTPLEFRRLLDIGSDPMKEILSASAGDFRVAGLTSGFTGRVKAIAPAITIMTDRIWGEVKFGRLNPYFNLVLERIETQFQLIANNIWKKVADEFADEYKGTVLIRNMRDRANGTAEYADGMIYHLRKRTEATATIVEQAPGFRNRAARVIQEVRGRLKTARSIDHVRIVKQGARDMMADRYATSQIIDLLARTRPDIFKELATHYGVTKAEDITELMLGEMIMMSEPALLKELIKRNGGVARTLTGESIRKGMAESFVKNRGMSEAAAMAEATRLSREIADAVVGAYEIAIERGARAADQAQFFSNYRSWFERSINHPFLALYPYSYMTQKAIPSMLKIMFLTPGPKGVIMPGWGFVKYQQVMEFMHERANTDSGILGEILRSEPALLLVGSLLPTNPESMGFSATSGARNYFINPALAGQEIDMDNIKNVLRGVKDTTWSGSFPGQVERIINTSQQVTQNTNVNQGIQDIIQQSSESIQDVVRQQLGDLRNP